MSLPEDRANDQFDHDFRSNERQDLSCKFRILALALLGFAFFRLGLLLTPNGENDRSEQATVDIAESHSNLQNQGPAACRRLVKWFNLAVRRPSERLVRPRSSRQRAPGSFLQGLDPGACPFRARFLPSRRFSHLLGISPGFGPLRGSPLSRTPCLARHHHDTTILRASIIL